MIRVGDEFSSDKDRYFDDLHTGNVARAARTVANDTSEILVAAMTGGDALASNIRTLREEQPDVLAVAYAGRGGDVYTLSGDVMTELAEAVAQGIIVVLPIASNRRGDGVMNLPVLSTETGRFMIVSGVNEHGRKADFAKSAPGVFWLPGTGIPEINKEGLVLYGKGVSYCVGLAAGVVGRLKAQFPNATAEELLGALRDTTSTFDGAATDAKPVVNTADASALLESRFPVIAP